MAQIKIKIGGELDQRSMDAALGQFEKRVAKTAGRMSGLLRAGFNRGLNGPAGAGGGAGGGRGGNSSLRREENAQVAAANRLDAMHMRLFKKRLRVEHSGELAAHRQRMSFLLEEARGKLNAQRRQQRDAMRERRQFAERTSYRATRFMLPNAPIGSMAARAAGDFVRGAGVDMSIGGSMGRAVSLDKQATDLSNSGYQRGQPGANGTRVDPRTLIAQARDVGSKYGLDAGDALGGLAQFQKITGDLDTGRKMLDDMAKLSAATGTNLTDMAAAAANVSNGLGDMPDKAKVVDDVMKTIAGQGKLGAVEISDLATQMARVAASAGQFTGSRSDNIKKMGALAQISRATGGAPSAAEAARSVVGFSNTLKKSARIGEFKSAGIDVFSDKKHTEFKDPLQLIKESLSATGGDLQKMNKLFMDVIGARGVAGLAKTFNSAGGGDAGLAAVDKELSKYLEGAALTQEEINESAKRASETAAAKAARFQNQLDAITERVANDLIPALEKLAPKILAAADLLGKLASWSLENPTSAITLAITAAIGRAGLESAFRASIEKAIMGRGIPGSAGGTQMVPGTGLGGNAGMNNKMMTIGAVLVGAEVGMAIGNAIAPFIFDAITDAQRKAQDKAVHDTLSDEDKVKDWERKAAAGTLSDADRAAMRAERDALVERSGSASFRRGEGETSLGFQDMFNNLLGITSDAELAQKQVDTANLEQMNEQIRRMSDALYAGIKVEVTNPDDFPTGDPNGGGNPVPGRQAPPMPGG